MFMDYGIKLHGVLGFWGEAYLYCCNNLPNFLKLKINHFPIDTHMNGYFLYLKSKQIKLFQKKIILKFLK